VTPAGRRSRTSDGADGPEALIHRSNSPKRATARVSGEFVPCLVAFPFGCSGHDRLAHIHAIWLISGVHIEPIKVEQEGADARATS
jgi:hypothetical protein